MLIREPWRCWKGLIWTKPGQLLPHATILYAKRIGIGRVFLKMLNYSSLPEKLVKRRTWVWEVNSDAVSQFQGPQRWRLVEAAYNYSPFEHQVTRIQLIKGRINSSQAWWAEWLRDERHRRVTENTANISLYVEIIMCLRWFVFFFFMSHQD